MADHWVTHDRLSHRPVTAGLQCLLDERQNSFTVETRHLQLFSRSGMFNEVVRQSEINGADPVLNSRQVFIDGRPGTALYNILFQRYQQRMGIGQLLHQRLIQRFDKAHIGYRGIDFLSHLQRRIQ